MDWELIDIGFFLCWCNVLYFILMKVNIIRRDKIKKLYCVIRDIKYQEILVYLFIDSKKILLGKLSIIRCSKKYKLVY